LQDGALRLARARGLAPVTVPLPPHLLTLPASAFREARLVWDRVARHYAWHLVIEDGVPPAPAPPGNQTAAVDLGEIHPAGVTERQGGGHLHLSSAAEHSAVYRQADG
jgi:hypothetical protein